MVALPVFGKTAFINSPSSSAPFFDKRYRASDRANITIEYFF
jgi:hypothetical protein